MSNYNTQLQSNNVDLQSILNTINNLPEAGGEGVELPTLTNEGSASDLLSGKELIDQDGSIVTGTMPNNGAISKTMDGINTKTVTIPSGYTSGGSVSLDDTIDNEIDEQTDLIVQIRSAVDNLPEAGSGNEPNDFFAVQVGTAEPRFFDVHPFKSGMTWREYSESWLMPYIMWEELEPRPVVDCYEDEEERYIRYYYHDFYIDAVAYGNIDADLDDPIQSYINDGHIYILDYYYL